MNDEVQDLINKQTDERLTRVENKIDIAMRSIF